MYILFQNYIGKVTGIAHVGITGSAVGAIAMVGQAGGVAGTSAVIGQAGGVAGTSAVIGQAGGIAGTTAGQAGSAASAAVTGQAGGATGAAAKAFAKGSAKFLGTVGGKVAVGVVGVAAVVGIGLGIHHASSEPERHIVAIEEEDGSGALMWEDGPAPVQEATTEEVSWVDLKLEETRQNVDSYRTTGMVHGETMLRLASLWIHMSGRIAFMLWRISMEMAWKTFTLDIGIVRQDRLKYDIPMNGMILTESLHITKGICICRIRQKIFCMIK
mgnify:CR=1 FL=1